MRATLTGIAASIALLGTAPLLGGSTGKGFAVLLSSAERPDADKARDADRKPAQLLAFAGIKSGSVVSELAPGGGYYSRVLSLAVGPKGHVYTVSNKPSAAVLEWARTHRNTTELSGQGMATLAPVPVDVVFTSLNYHDFKNVKDGDSDVAIRLNKAAYAALKPGGVYLINDHEAAVGAGSGVTSRLHRIESAQVIREVLAAGFELDARGDMLRHADDDHSKHEKDVARGKTDQMVLRFVKPRGRR